MTIAISEHADNTIMLLVAWELFGYEADPKQLLRGLDMTDLLAVKNNIRVSGEADDFLSTKMVAVELMYRQGFLREDWSILQTGKNVSLRYSPLKKDRTPSMLDLITSGAC